MTDISENSPAPQPAAPMDPRHAKAEAKALKAYAKASRPWFKKKRWWLATTAVVVVGFAVAGTAGGGGGGTDSSVTEASVGQSQGADDAKDVAADESAAEVAPKMTSGQENALRAAENYLDTMPFSRKGLIQQLSSPAGDDYDRADAKFAAKNVKADWNAEAVEAAENYLEMMPMSRDALIEQLSSSAGDQFTNAQAEFAANKVL